MPNNPAQELWQHTTFDPGYPPVPKLKPKQSDIVYALTGDLSQLGPPVLTNPSPLTLYSLLRGGPDQSPGCGKLNLSRWNILGLDRTWLDIDSVSPNQIQSKFGTSKHPIACRHAEDYRRHAGVLWALLPVAPGRD